MESPPTAENPFFHRGPVRDPAAFFGRDEELAFARDLLRRGQSVAVHGPRRIGKTSLLFQLARADAAGAIWAYVDGGMLDGLGEEWLFGEVDRALGGAGETLPYPAFVERLRGLAAQGRRLVLALDEFELVAANPLLGTTLFNRLRALAAQLPLQFVTAASRPLLDLTFAHPATLSSPFFNIFAPLRLGLLRVEGARAMLATLSARHGRRFAPDTLDFALGLAGPQPLFAQVAGYRVFAALGGAGALDEAARELVRRQVEADLDPHLRYAWSLLDDEARYALAALPLLGSPAAHPALERLEEAGLLVAGAYVGRALESFVRRQAVDGLLQGGPLIMDLRRGLVAAGGAPVHLTPTEYAALRLFMERPGQVLTPEVIEAALWPGERAPDPERARGVVKKLRAALGAGGELIANRRGQGYLLLP